MAQVLLRSNFARSATTANFAARSQVRSKIPGARRSYATETNPGKPLGNAPLYLSLAGLAGLSYYVYLEYGDKAKAKATQNLPPLTSAFDKDGGFVAFPLKKVSQLF